MKLQKKRATYAALINLLSQAAVLSLLGGCAVGPKYQDPSQALFAKTVQWSAPSLPAHQGEITELKNWWASFNDPLLSELISAAQIDNPNVSAAAARIEQSRANFRAVSAGSLPTVDGSLTAGKRSGSPSTTRNTPQIGIDANWELDLFGSVSRSKNIAQLQTESAQGNWHDARVTLGAEVALVYIQLKTCEQTASIAQLDVTSQAKTLALTAQKVAAGFTAPAEASLLRANVANAQNQLQANLSDCASLINSLSYLSGIRSDVIAARSKAQIGVLPKPATFDIPTVPAALLMQRPDLVSQERQLAAALEDVGLAIAGQYPRIMLNGNIGLSTARLIGEGKEKPTWQFGLNIDIPLFDAGRRAAAVDGARGRLAEQQALTELKVAGAVRDVQESLIRLSAANQRQTNANAATKDFEAFFAAAQTRWNVGVGTLLELEEARRLSMNAKLALIQLERERITHWINLYKSVGGGWSQTGLADIAAVRSENK